MILQILHRLSPKVNLIFNVLLLAAWAVGFYGLWQCTIHHNVLTLCDETSPCKIYNVVFASVVLAL